MKRKLSRRITYNLEDVHEVAEKGIENSLDELTDERFGWMIQELERRK